jgi:hypothetical protein
MALSQAEESLGTCPLRARPNFVPPALVLMTVVFLRGSGVSGGAFGPARGAVLRQGWAGIQRCP